MFASAEHRRSKVSSSAARSKRSSRPEFRHYIFRPSDSMRWGSIQQCGCSGSTRWQAHEILSHLALQLRRDSPGEQRHAPRQAGYDDAKISQKTAWTIEQFRDAAKRMTRDTDGDGKIDTWGFAATLTHLQHLFLNEFGPGIWGKSRSRTNELLGYDSDAQAMDDSPCPDAGRNRASVFSSFQSISSMSTNHRNPAYAGDELPARSSTS